MNKFAVLLLFFCQLTYGFEGKLNDKEVERLLLSSTNVDHFLSQLQDSPTAKSYLRRYIPIWESDSLQKSYAFCPRILMYNEDASFVMSIIGCPKLTVKQDDVEIVQWNESKKEFELYAVHFKYEGKPVKPVTIGEKNPSECMRCHRGGIAIGAFDPYSWPNADLTYSVNNWAKLFVTSQTGSSPVYDEGLLVRQIHGLNRYKFFEVLPVLNGYPYIRIEAFEQLSKDATAIDLPLVSQWKNTEFGQSCPSDEFNRLLAEKNHIRTIYWARKFFGERYKDLKYFLLAALADCDNFAKFYPESSDYPDPYSSREAYSKLQFVYERIGLRVMAPRIYDSEDFFKSYNMVRQIEAVRKVYYGFLAMGYSDEVRDFNLNPIKMSMHPAWSAAELANAFLENENDFADLREINGLATHDILRIRNAMPPNKPGPQWEKWLAVSRMSRKGGESESAFQIRYAQALDEIEYEDKAFQSFCNAIEENYNKFR